MGHIGTFKLSKRGLTASGIRDVLSLECIVVCECGLIVVAGLVGGDLSESGETRWELLS